MSVEQDKSVKMPSYDSPKRILPGRRLRAAREITHMTIAEIANHLRLDPRLITALEEDKYDELPGDAYVCGYLRSYARILKLPENEIVQAFTQGQDIKATIIPENVNILPVRHPYKRLLQLGIVLVLMLLITAGFLWIAEQLHIFEFNKTATSLSPDRALAGLQQQIVNDNSQPNTSEIDTTAVENIPTPIIQTVPATVTEDKSKDDELMPRPGAGQSVILRLNYHADSWTDVQDVRGKQIVYRMVSKDSVLTLRGEPPLRVLLGYARGVKINYQGKPFDFSNYVKDDVAIFTIGNSSEEKI